MPDYRIIDDPVKGRECAGSEVIRRKTWAWFKSEWMRGRTKPREEGGNR